VRVFHPTLLRALRRVDGRSHPPEAPPAALATRHPNLRAPRPLRGKALRAFSTLRFSKPRRVDGRSQPPKALAASFATCHSSPRTLAHYVEKRCARFPPYAPASHVGWVAEASHRKPRPPASPPATRARAPSPLRGKAPCAFSTLRSSKPRRVDGRSQPPKGPAASFATCHSSPRTLTITWKSAVRIFHPTLQRAT